MNAELPISEAENMAAADISSVARVSGFEAIIAVAGYYRIASEVAQLRRELVLPEGEPQPDDLLRAARVVGLKARIVERRDAAAFARSPVPAILRLRTGTYVVLASAQNDEFAVVDPSTGAARTFSGGELLAEVEPMAILLARRFLGPGSDPQAFNIKWFLPSIWRYRRPLGHVLLASLFLQMFGLVTPMFFQVVIDKVLVHQSMSTLHVLVAGLVAVTIFDVLLQYLRAYALTHTSNRIDVELGSRLFAHLMRLPVSYFETRPAGQTVARVRELENIRSFLTGQGLFSALDLVFALLCIGVLFLYSTKLALIVVLTLPLYIVIATVVGPVLRERIQERFERGAYSQQFLVETVVGAQTVKASAVEPAMRKEWEERLAGYVRTSFAASMVGAGGHGAIELVTKLSTAMILLFGATAVMNGELTVGALVAFNMIANQISQPVLRLSQLWQDFQQMRISVARLGDILNSAPEPSSPATIALPPPKGAIEFRNVSFRYAPTSQDVLRNISLAVRPGEVIGIVGPSGSGKSSLAKLVQRFYSPHEGQVLLDGMDLVHVDPAWLRRHIGVVLQENLLFNRTLHENIAFADPAMPRSRVMAVAKLAGADEFISRLPSGYDTLIEERGANLSGGQRQRIAIARALATNPRILIFDEATSALDYESERIVQANMRHIVKGRTVIIIAHRLSTVRNADRIVGLLDGRIVEIGSHDELIGRADGLYARLWNLQSAGVAA